MSSFSRSTTPRRVFEPAETYGVPSGVSSKTHVSVVGQTLGQAGKHVVAPPTVPHSTGVISSGRGKTLQFPSSPASTAGVRKATAITPPLAPPISTIATGTAVVRNATRAIESMGAETEAAKAASAAAAARAAAAERRAEELSAELERTREEALAARQNASSNSNTANRRAAAAAEAALAEARAEQERAQAAAASALAEAASASAASAASAAALAAVRAERDRGQAQIERIQAEQRAPANSNSANRAALDEAASAAAAATAAAAAAADTQRRLEEQLAAAAAAAEVAAAKESALVASQQQAAAAAAAQAAELEAARAAIENAKRSSAANAAKQRGAEAALEAARAELERLRIAKEAADTKLVAAEEEAASLKKSAASSSGMASHSSVAAASPAPAILTAGDRKAITEDLLGEDGLRNVNILLEIADDSTRTDLTPQNREDVYRIVHALLTNVAEGEKITTATSASTSASASASAATAAPADIKVIKGAARNAIDLAIIGILDAVGRIGALTGRTPDVLALKAAFPEVNALRQAKEEETRRLIDTPDAPASAVAAAAVAASAAAAAAPSITYATIAEAIEGAKTITDSGARASLEAQLKIINDALNSITAAKAVVDSSPAANAAAKATASENAIAAARASAAAVTAINSIILTGPDAAVVAASNEIALSTNEKIHSDKEKVVAAATPAAAAATPAAATPVTPVGAAAAAAAAAATAAAAAAATATTPGLPGGPLSPPPGAPAPPTTAAAAPAPSPLIDKVALAIAIVEYMTKALGKVNPLSGGGDAYKAVLGFLQATAIAGGATAGAPAATGAPAAAAAAAAAAATPPPAAAATPAGASVVPTATGGPAPTAAAAAATPPGAAAPSAFIPYNPTTIPEVKLYEVNSKGTYTSFGRSYSTDAQEMIYTFRVRLYQLICCIVLGNDDELKLPKVMRYDHRIGLTPEKQTNILGHLMAQMGAGRAVHLNTSFVLALWDCIQIMDILFKTEGPRSSVSPADVQLVQQVIYSFNTISYNENIFPMNPITATLLSTVDILPVNKFQVMFGQLHKVLFYAGLNYSNLPTGSNKTNMEIIINRLHHATRAFAEITFNGKTKYTGGAETKKTLRRSTRKTRS